MEAATAVMWLTLITIATPTSDNVTDSGWFNEVLTTLSTNLGHIAPLK